VREVLPYLQNLSAIAFVLLGAFTVAAWLRHRDHSLLFLGLAIVLLSAVSLAGRLSAIANTTVPGLTEISLVAFMASGYALLLYRNSLIPLKRAWLVAAFVAIAASTLAFEAAEHLAAPASILGIAGFGLVLGWSATVLEPIIRFWLAARGLPAVQAWRLRTLSLGFAGLIAVLLFAVTAGSQAQNPAAQVLIQLAALAIIPLLYVSFSPPAWLRREWRASEEEGLRVFMQDLLIIDDDPDVLARRALDWTMRIVGGAAAASFDGAGLLQTSSGLTTDYVDALRARLATLPEGVSRQAIDGAARTLIVLPMAGPAGAGKIVVLSGPFTPGFGGDEISRVQQFLSAVAAALDRVRLIRELKETNRRLREANQHKSVFLANMSHELRTPLNAIIGFSELLIDSDSNQFDAATQLRFCTQIHSSGKHLLGLINDILDLSKVEAGQMELRLQTVPVEQVVAQVLDTIEPLAGQKRIKIRADAASAGEVLVDAGKLKQMLLNLVSNAIKFTPEEGDVTITAVRLPSAVEISVTDTGIGISDSDQAQLFEEFHQVDQGPGRREQGTGLGLALTRRFAALHGGEVNVHSEVGKGSVFTLRLPIQAAAPVAAPAPAAAKTQDMTHPLVLVIEDDPAAAELLCRQLEGAGFRTQVARTGTAALAMARELRPAAITLDILLPELDGWEVMARLKREAATSNIPVVIVSVVDNPELGMALGALDYFVKPIDGKELVTRLSRFQFERSNGTTVLVVDDDASNRLWLTTVLEPAGFAVINAAGGREAIQLAKLRRPDLVLLDLMMPDVNGFAVVEALRADPATRHVPIMILTARNLTAADKRLLNGHVSTILSRGSTAAADLIDHLRQLVPQPIAVS
jgi:signal transduction histidine kinase/DNA-binding response OmpR family regulator